jgi:hypothetical protein
VWSRARGTSGRPLLLLLLLLLELVWVLLLRAC